MIVYIYTDITEISLIKIMDLLTSKKFSRRNPSKSFLQHVSLIKIIPGLSDLLTSENFFTVAILLKVSTACDSLYLHLYHKDQFN